MSYCRNNGVDSDVYVIATFHEGNPAWECVACILSTGRHGRLVHTRTQMLNHLLVHRLKGDRVPERAMDRLRKEIKEAS